MKIRVKGGVPADEENQEVEEEEEELEATAMAR